MPVMNGLETAKALRTHSSTSEIPLIAFTASISYSETDKYEVAGFNAVLLKPVQMDELATVLTDNLKTISKSKSTEDESLIELEETGFENIRIIDLEAALKELMLLQTEWEFVKTNRFVNVVIEFSDKLLNIGEEYTINSIIRYGQKLKLNAQSFDTEKMEKTLNAFPSLKEELNSYLND
jgi:CheY-like chemotaxis protein